LGRYKETNDNIMNLLYDWNDVKKRYSVEKDILNIGASFSYNEQDDEEYIHFKSQNGDKTKMLLRNGSSGLQSVIPVVLLFDYLTRVFYEKEKPLSPNEKELIFDISISEIVRSKIRMEDLDFEDIIKIIKEQRKETIGKYHFSKLIIEEPEQNLYPETQKELIYHFLKVFNNSDKDHQLFITTHSPFILYSLNNCMMGYLVKEKMPETEQRELLSQPSWIDPALVSVWQLEDGKLKDVKEEDTKVIGTHSFDEIMNKVMSEYFEMLGYFGDAE
jgi:predicted ATP-dependent endonuclease of OLD family